MPTREINSSFYNVKVADDYIKVDCANNAVAVNLFDAVLQEDKEITVKKTDSTTNAVTVEGLTIKVEGGFYTFRAIDGSWEIVSTNIQAQLDPIDTRSDDQTSTGSTITLGDDVDYGEFKSDLTGITRVNLFDDDVAGCESTSGWTTSIASVAIDSSNEFEGTNCLKATLTSTAGGCIYDNISIDETKYYLATAYVKIGDCTNINLFVRTTGAGAVKSATATTNSTYTRLGIVLEPSDLTGLTAIQYYIRLTGANTQYGFVDAIQLQEITSAEYALGADALLTKYPYHRGTADSDKQRILSTGASDTTVAYTPVLRSVPNGVADTFSVHDGVKVQNVSDPFTLLSANIDSVADGSNLQRAVIGLDAFAGIKTQVVDTIDGGTLVSGLSGETDGYDTAGDAGKWYTDASNLYILAELGTWADVAAARTALTSTVTTKVRYELATPITTQIDPQTLDAEPNGTVTIVPYVKETGTYATEITIKDSTLPISSLDFVNLIDPDTNEAIPVDLSDCTVAGDGLTFTITGASADEDYSYGYNYVNLSTTPTMVYSYPINLYGQLVGAIDQIKELNKKVELLKDRVLVK